MALSAPNYQHIGSPPTPTPHSGARAGPHLPAPPPTRLPRLLPGCAPERAKQPGLWTAERLNCTLGPKEPGHEAPAPRGRTSAPPRNLPCSRRCAPLLAKLRCLALYPPAPARASRALPELPPLAAGTQSFLPRQPGRYCFDSARCSANRAAKLQLSGVGSLPTCGRNWC